MKLIDLKAWKTAHKKDGKAPEAGVAMTPRTEAPLVVEIKSGRVGVDDVRTMLRDIGAPDVDIEKALDTIVDGDIVATYTMSTDTVDRPGDVIHQEGWELDDYRANPVMLFAHDSYQPPIGMAVGTYLQRGALKGTFKFTPEAVYPFGATIGRLVKGGFMRAGSVGFQPIEVEVAKERVDPNNPMHDWFPPLNFKRQKLLEFTACPIPANPDALVDARGLPSGDIKAVREWAERCLAGEGGKALTLPRDVIERMAKAGKRSTVIIELRDVDGEQVLEVVPAAPEATATKAPGDDVAPGGGDLVCPACGHVDAAEAFVAPVPADDEASSEGAPVEEPVEEPVEDPAAQLPKGFEGWHADFADPAALRAFVAEVTERAVAAALAKVTGRLPD